MSQPIERVVYLGTPAISVPPLRALVEAGIEVALVITGTDKRRGRGSKLVPTPVKAAALDLGLPVSHDLEDALTCDAELGVVVAYGRIIPGSILDRLEMVNIHFSLLPRWRGAAPVERAILAGDSETGVCLMALASELDTGDIYATRTVPIGPSDSLETLRSTLVEVGSELLVDSLTAGLAEPKSQEGETTYAHKLTADDYRLDLNRSAADLDRQIRVGRAWCEFRGKRMRIWDATPGPDRGLDPGQLDSANLGTGDGTLVLETIQPEGKPRMPALAWLNGAQPEDHERFS